LTLKEGQPTPSPKKQGGSAGPAGSKPKGRPLRDIVGVIEKIISTFSEAVKEDADFFGANAPKYHRWLGDQLKLMERSMIWETERLAHLGLNHHNRICSKI
jgi:hypothetical protein